ncbi:unnamed protein product [Symbiodinium sp. CCMP2592]|nr:unnamed protein product [Symbiodinium sp. CCMP2592]
MLPVRVSGAWSGALRASQEHSTFQLLQVSQAALDVPAEHVEAQREDDLRPEIFVTRIDRSPLFSSAAVSKGTFQGRRVLWIDALSLRPKSSESAEDPRAKVAQGFFHAVGSAEAAAVLQPGLIAERTFEEVFVTASSRQQQPVALTQKSAEAAVGTETICIIVGAVLLAVLVCLIFCCFRPSVSYEEAGWGSRA